MIDTAGHAQGGRADGPATRAPRGSTPPRRTRSSRGNAYENLAASGFEQIVVTDTIPLRDGAPDNIRVLSLRRPAHRLDPPDLHRRLGLRGLRRREPAVLTSTAAALLHGSARPQRGRALPRARRRPAQRHRGRARPQAAAADPARADRRGGGAGGGGRPAALAARERPGTAGRSTICSRGDYGAFEDDLATLAERGFVLRGGGPTPSRERAAGRRGRRRRRSAVRQRRQTGRAAGRHRHRHATPRGFAASAPTRAASCAPSASARSPTRRSRSARPTPASSRIPTPPGRRGRPTAPRVHARPCSLPSATTRRPSAWRPG